MLLIKDIARRGERTELPTQEQGGEVGEEELQRQRQHGQRNPNVRPHDGQRGEERAKDQLPRAQKFSFSHLKSLPKINMGALPPYPQPGNKFPGAPF